MTEILTDGIILEKNLILLKNLNGLDRNELGGKEPVFIDVWPVSILDSDQILTDGHFDFDESSLFLLQLGKYKILENLMTKISARDHFNWILSCLISTYIIYGI